ncbi:MAG: hypothetical protein WEF99_06865 [Thermoanaerobaculia bacterium]
MKTTRRQFARIAGAAGTGAALGRKAFGFQWLEPVAVDNPLAAYPSCDWEKVYRDQYRYDSSFTWVCSPNCTHECRLRAFVRNGVFTRAEILE